MTEYNLNALVVEDDDSWQEILSELLADNGLTVDVASHLNEALTYLKSRVYRLVIVDLSLSGNHHHNTDGLRILEAIRNINPRSQAILLTGFATVELAVSTISEYKAFTVLRKESFEREEFNIQIQRALSIAPVSSISADKQNFSSPKAHISLNTEPINSSLGMALVVEDDAGWQNIIVELLTEAGYQTCLCSSFGEASCYLRRAKFTLAVIDLSLAGNWPVVRSEIELEDLAGFLLLNCTRADGIPTIVVSGIATPEDIQRAYTEQDIFAYLEKQTFDRNTFLKIVHEVHQLSRPDSKLTRLTSREREVLHYLTQGLTNKEIATKLVVTPNTIKRHVKAIFEKLEVNTRSAAVARAIE
jgi:DNA-binding NarL/FixJ family response regulator